METITTHHAQVTHVLKQHFGNAPITGVELGTNAADLTKTILRELPNLRLYTVDPWSYQEGNLFEGGHPQEEHDLIRDRAYTVLAEYGDRVTIMPITSDEAFEQFKDFDLGFGLKADFVWIDGDHTLTAVEKDILNALKFVKRGGIIGGHDYNITKEAVERALPGKEIFTGADLTWWVFV